MKKVTAVMTEETRNANTKTLEAAGRADNLTQAVDRIQQRYGNDLDAFFRDAKAHIVRRNAIVTRKAQIG